MSEKTYVKSDVHARDIEPDVIKWVLRTERLHQSPPNPLATSPIFAVKSLPTWIRS